MYTKLQYNCYYTPGELFPKNQFLYALKNIIKEKSAKFKHIKKRDSVSDHNMRCYIFIHNTNQPKRLYIRMNVCT